jgi:hypothetical protein
MTVQHDPDAILAAWLEEGPAALPDTVRRAIAVNTRTTRQKRLPIWQPRRLPTMNGTSRLILAAVAVVAIALGGLYLSGLTRNGAIGGPPSPSPSPAASPSPTAAASDASSPTAELNTPSPLQGRAASFPAPFSYTLPAGEGLVATDDSFIGVWQFRYPVAQGAEEYQGGVALRAVTGGRKDPCDEGSSSRELSNSQAWIDYFKTIPTVHVSDVQSVTVDGRPAKQAVLDFDPATAACPDVWLWAEPASITQNAGRESTRVTILQVGGHDVAILTWANGRLMRVFDQLIASIRFDAPRPSSS